jgi:hypothetical protein
MNCWLVSETNEVVSVYLNSLAPKRFLRGTHFAPWPKADPHPTTVQEFRTLTVLTVCHSWAAHKPQVFCPTSGVTLFHCMNTTTQSCDPLVALAVSKFILMRPGGDPHGLNVFRQHPVIFPDRLRECMTSLEGYGVYGLAIYPTPSIITLWNNKHDMKLDSELVGHSLTRSNMKLLSAEH